MAGKQNWNIVGHGRAVNFLRRGLLNGRSRHAYLLTGPAAVGKMTLALRFAMALNCQVEAIEQRPCFACSSCQTISAGNATDVIVVQDYIRRRKCKSGSPPCSCSECKKRSSGRIYYEDIRDHLLPWVALKPYSLPFKVAIYENFHLIFNRLQDILLKTIEEPPPSLKQLILTDTPSEIQSTIRSRAQIITLRPVPQETIKTELLRRGADETRADLLARLSNGRVGWALGAMVDETKLELWRSSQDELLDVLAGSRVQRLKIAERMGKISWVTKIVAATEGGEDTEVASERGERVSQRVALYSVLEIWLSFWRDVLLACNGNPANLTNINRREEINQLARRMDSAASLRAVQATRKAMNSFDPNRNINSNVRLVLDVLFLEYPGLD